MRQGTGRAEDSTKPGYTGQPKVEVKQASRVISAAHQFDNVDCACYLDHSAPVVLVHQPLQKLPKQHGEFRTRLS